MTLKEQKQAHALNMCAQLIELKLLIESQPDLWFGGLPPSLLNLTVALDSHIYLITNKFELGSE